MCGAPDIDVPPPPAQRQLTKEPEIKARNGDPAKRRRRGYAALMTAASPSLQPPVTTATLGG